MMKKFTKQEMSWAFYDWANSAYSMTVTTTILPIYFKLVAENGGMSDTTSTAMWGYTLSFATLIVAILAPIIGGFADFKGNKKRFFKMFVTLGVSGTVCLALAPSNNPFLLLGIYTITAIGFSGANNVYDSMLVDVTTIKRMDKVSSLGFGLGYIGSTIPFMMCMGVVLLSETINVDMYTACKVSFLITAMWWGAFTLPLLKHVNQVHYVEKEEHAVRNAFQRLGKTLTSIRQNKSIMMFLLAYFFYIDGVDTIIGMSTAYGTDLGISSTDLLIILLITQFVAFPFTLLYGRLAERYGSKRMIYVGIWTYFVICCYGYFISDATDFFILAMGVGSAQGGIQAISRSHFSKLVPRENAAEFFGFYNIFGKFAAILGPIMVGVITQATGCTNNGVLSLVVLFLIALVIFKKSPDVCVE